MKFSIQDIISHHSNVSEQILFGFHTEEKLSSFSMRNRESNILLFDWSSNDSFRSNLMIPTNDLIFRVLLHFANQMSTESSFSYTLLTTFLSISRFTPGFFTKNFLLTSSYEYIYIII
jgi:hypothetical protein